jgi:hypothetical protein
MFILGLICVKSLKDIITLSDSEIDEYIKELQDEKIKRAGKISKIFVTGTHYEFSNKFDKPVTSFQYRDSVKSSGCSYNWDLFDKCQFHDKVELGCHCDGLALIFQNCMIHLMQKGYSLSNTNGWHLFFIKQ